MRQLLIAGLLACTCLQPALAAPATYDEATNGDLATGQLGFPLPALVFDVGVNTIKGEFATVTADRDSFAFFVPVGLRVVSASVTLVDLVGDVASSFWALLAGTNIVDISALVGGVAAPSPGTTPIPGTPLAASTYVLYHDTYGGFGSSFAASYSFEFVVEAVAAPVPEPATIAVLGAGLAALGVARRRRTG